MGTNESSNIEQVESDKSYVPTVLSLLEHDENIMSDVQKEIMEEELSELEQVEEGQFNVAGIYAYDSGENIEVKVYIRNGLSKKVNLESIPFIITNSKHEMLAYQIFNLESLGDIPPHSARPLKLFFDKKNVNVDKIPMDDWMIVFDAGIEAHKNIKMEYENLPEEIDEADKLVFDKFLSELPNVEEGNFDIYTFSIGLQRNGNILVTIVMRNGSNKIANLPKIPVTIKDASGTIVKSELFDLGDFSVSPFKAKICNLAFPTGTTLNQDISLQDWTASFRLEQVGSEINE